MLIKSLIKRTDGTVVDIAGTRYHFAPNANGEHVCEVSDEHIGIFLDIVEGYEPVTKIKAQNKAKTETNETNETT